jgi:hypothetical protein
MTFMHICIVENSGLLCPVIFHFLLSVIISRALLISLRSSFKFSKAAKLFVILSLWYSLTFPSSSFFLLNCSRLFSLLIFYVLQCLPNFCKHQIVIIITFSTPKIHDYHPLFINVWSMSLCVFPSAQVQVCLWLFRPCTTRFFDVVKFTTLTPLALFFHVSCHSKVLVCKYLLSPV